MSEKIKVLSGCWMIPLLLLSLANLGATSNDIQLVEAVERGDREALRSLLEQQADVNAPQADGTTALHWTVRGDDVESARRLIDAGEVYESYSSAEEIEARHRAAGRDPKLGYDNADRDLTEDQRAAFRAEGRAPF